MMDQARHLVQHLTSRFGGRLVTGGHTAVGADGPRTVWYFAEGYTAPGFDQYLAILNPNDTAAQVCITYYLNNGRPIVRRLVAPSSARTTVAVHDPQHGVGRGREVSAKVESLNGVGIVVERSMYFTYQLQPGAHPRPARRPLSPDLIPPEEMIFVGKGGRETFVAVGRWFLDCFIELGDLRPDESILDVGCGIGRIAASLTTYLNGQARYEGFDIVPKGIDWCRATITPRFPNFHFQLADIYNATYNPSGTLQPTDYRFPYPDASFDFVFATSVFTHMLPRDVEHYLSEIGRVLKSGGRCVLTYFLIDETSLRLVENGQSTLDFRNVGDGFRTTHQDRPENAVAYDETAIRSLFERSALGIVEPIHYGSWSGRGGGYSYQDIILAVKDGCPGPGRSDT